jgi:hypothetical protein
MWKQHNEQEEALIQHFAEHFPAFAPAIRMLGAYFMSSES